MAGPVHLFYLHLIAAITPKWCCK